MKKSITAALIVSLLAIPPLTEQSRATQKACGAPCILAALVVVLGAVFFLGIKKACEKIQPPSQPPPPPPNPPCSNCNCTNAVPGHPSWPKTNCPARKTITGTMISMNADTNSIGLWDIRDAGFIDPLGQPYETLQTYRVSTSTNLRDWSESFCVTQWVSELSVMTVVYVGGLATATNWAEDPYGTNCWSLDLDLMHVDEPQRFFKLTP